MALSPDAKERWRRGLIGSVELASARGMGAILLLGIGGLLVFALPAYSVVDWAITGKAPETGELTKGLLVASMAANTVLLLIFPLLAILLTNPGHLGAPAIRLRMLVDRRTPLMALIGVAVTLASLLALGSILAGLEAADLFHAEESDLVPQIQALLTPAVIVAVPVVAAVTEEVYFRGMLQPRVGIIGSSILFGLVHIGYGTILQLIAPFALGILFGILFQKTRTLWAPIAAHYSFDQIQFLLLHFLR